MKIPFGKIVWKGERGGDEDYLLFSLGDSILWLHEESGNTGRLMSRKYWADSQYNDGKYWSFIPAEDDFEGNI